MKKKTFLLIVILIGLICSTTIVQAKSTTFYEGEYIDGIYMNKQKKGSSTIYYQKARFFRQSGTNRFAYCIDPFVFFEEGSIYEETITPSNLTAKQKETISLIAYFGYGYKNHTDAKWYAITQFMIWKAADPSGNFYFTDGLNGPKIERFTKEMSEINNLITNYKKNTSLNGKTYTLIEGQDFIAEDINKVLPNYKSSNSNFSIQGNKLIGKNLKEGEYIIKLTRTENNYKKPILFYQSSNSQALMQTGDISKKQEQLKVDVVKTEIELTKIDKDTKSTTPSGEGDLKGAIYGLYKESGEQIDQIIIDENSKGKIENIPLGNYYLQEINSPNGYQLDNKKYDIKITKDNSKIKLILENEIIKKKIIIYKKYDENKKKPEENISFSIYDKNNNKVAVITTDKNGRAEITLPYGTYKIVQENTTKGYQKVEDILISVTDLKEEIITLTDYKIKVPNTNTNVFIYIINLIKTILKL